MKIEAIGAVLLFCVGAALLESIYADSSFWESVAIGVGNGLVGCGIYAIAKVAR